MSINQDIQINIYIIEKTGCVCVCHSPFLRQPALCCSQNWNRMLISHKLVHKHAENSICLIIFFLCLATVPLLKLASNCTFIIFTHSIFFLTCSFAKYFLCLHVILPFWCRDIRTNILRPFATLWREISCLFGARRLWELQEVPHILTLFVGPCEMILIPSETIPRRSASWKRAWQQRPVDVTL